MTERMLDALLDELAADPAALDRLRRMVGVDGSRTEASSRAVYTTSTLAVELGRSERSIRAAIARGELHAVKRGRGWVISADAASAWARAAARTQAVNGGPRKRTREPSGSGPARRGLQSRSTTKRPRTADTAGDMAQGGLAP